MRTTSFQIYGGRAWDVDSKQQPTKKLKVFGQGWRDVVSYIPVIRERDVIEQDAGKKRFPLPLKRKIIVEGKLSLFQKKNGDKMLVKDKDGRRCDVNSCTTKSRIIR